MFCSIHFQGSFELLVAVNDIDSFFGFYKYFGEFIDVIYIEESLQPNGSFSTPQSYTGMYDKATISLSFQVACTDNYYDSNCATFCEPSVNHTCGEDGNIVCRNSYYGTQCNVFCEGRNDSLGHYQCSRNGSKICLEGYQDPDTNCTTRKWVHCYSDVIIYPTSLVPRPLPDFISQLWRKIGKRPGSKTTSRTGNGGLGQYVTWTWFVLTKSTISGP